MSDADLDVGTPNFDQRYADWSTGKTTIHPVLGDTSKQSPAQAAAVAQTQPKVFRLADADPYADPAMLAFARGAGASEGLARLAVQNQKSKINRQIAAAGPAYQDSLRQGLSQIAGNAEASGMYQSGKRLQDQNDFQVSAARQQNSWLQGLQDQSNDADLQLAMQIAQLQQQKAEQELQSRYNVAQRLAGLVG